MPRQPGDRHQPAHALGDLVEAGAVGVGPVLAEAGDAGENDPRIDLAQALVVDAEPVLDVGAEVLDHHVGLPDHAAKHRDAVLLLHVQRDAALVAVDALEIRAVALAAHAFGGVDLFRRLDLDDVGAPVGELAHRRRARAHAGQVEHDEAGKRSGAFGHWGKFAAAGPGWSIRTRP